MTEERTEEALMAAAVTALRAAGYVDAAIMDTGGGVECIVIVVPHGEVCIGAFNEAGENTALVTVTDEDGCQVREAWTAAAAAAVVAVVGGVVKP
jgi:hypothetical protein